MTECQFLQKTAMTQKIFNYNYSWSISMREFADKKNEKRKKIIETAYNLFQQKTVSATAVDDVVKAAGIARGTFYLYFKDKSDLLEQIILYKSAEAMKQLLEDAQTCIADEDTSLFDMASRFADMYIDFMVSHADVLAVVTKNISACIKLLPNFYDENVESLYVKIIKKFEENGCSAEKAHRTVYIVADLIGSVCSDAVLDGKPFAIDEIREDVKNAALSVVMSATDKKELK